jgi:hypothetical protein
MTLQINNPEIVNLMIEERVARVERRLTVLKERRKQEATSLQTLWETQLTIFDQLVHDEVEEDVTAMLEAFSKLYIEQIPEYHLEVQCRYPTYYSADAFGSLKEYAISVVIRAGADEDSDPHHDGFDEDTDIGAFMEGRSVNFSVPLDASVQEGVKELLVAIETIDSEQRQLDIEIKDREKLGRKLLAQLTAQTLKNDPEQFERIRSAIMGLEQSQLCIGTLDEETDVVEGDVSSR